MVAASIFVVVAVSSGMGLASRGRAAYHGLIVFFIPHIFFPSVQELSSLRRARDAASISVDDIGIRGVASIYDAPQRQAQLRLAEERSDQGAEIGL